MELLLDSLARHARERPDRAAFFVWRDDRYRTLSRRDFAELCRSFAALLDAGLSAQADAAPAGAAQADAASGGVVFIALRPGPVLLSSAIGCMLAGYTPSLIPFPSPKQDLGLYLDTHRAVFERTRPAAIVTYPEIAADLRAVAPPGTTVLPCPEDGLPPPPAGPAPASVRRPEDVRRPGDVALLQHSSGTTGLKKGVALTFGQIARQTRAYGDAAGLDDTAVVASWLPLYHDLGLISSYLIPLARGVPVVTMDPFEWVRDPLSLLRAIGVFRATHCWMPNFAFQHIVNAAGADERFDLTSMRMFVATAEAVKPATFRAFAGRFGADGAPIDKLTASYGMAEAVLAVTQSPPGRPPRVERVSRALTIPGRDGAASLAGPVFLADPAGAAGEVELMSNGPVLPGVELAVLDGSGRIRTGPDSEVAGEFLVRGSFVFDGYFRNPDATASAFLDGWYRTGDVGFMRGGEAFMCGRRKELVVVHGRNYYFHDIEEIVSAIPPVVPGRVVAVGVEDAETGSDEVVILAELRTGEGAEAGPDLRRRIKRAVHDRLDLTPKGIEFVPHGWLVKTSSGKISRAYNLERFRARSSDAAPVPLPVPLPVHA